MPRAWGGLSASYRGRLERAGITKSAYESGVSLQAARGHAKTPERPSRALKSPERYREYVANRDQLRAQLTRTKARMFGDRIKYRQRATSARDAQLSVRQLRLALRFLAEHGDDLSEVDWSDDDNDGLRYH